MSNLIVLGFTHELDAFQTRMALARLQAERLIQMEAAAVVTRDTKGKVRFHEALNLAAPGARRDTIWGVLIGLLFLNPVLGVVISAGVGALSGAQTGIGITQQFIKDLGATLAPGTSALFIRARKSRPNQVLKGLRPFIGKAKVLRASLSKAEEEELRRAFERGSPVQPEPSPSALTG